MLINLLAYDLLYYYAYSLNSTICLYNILSNIKITEMPNITLNFMN